MKRYVTVIIILLISGSSLQSGDWKGSPYFDTKFLVQYDLVSQHLIHDEGFQEGFFLTEDTVSINYLWLKRPNARYTVVYCCGFWPGRKEGLATFYAMMPDDCNLLFFDARGHGKSGGRFFSRIWGYGAQEYKDVIGALHFAVKQQRCPIILYGVCAGAFHAVHAISHLQERGMLHHAMQVKGLIFDSGWSSIADVSQTAFVSELDGMVRRRLKQVDWLYRPISAITSIGVQAVHCCIARPVLSWRKKRMTLIDKINHLDIPIFYIHAEDDQYARIEPVKQLAKETKQATCWWISEPSKHACHHLKVKEQYRERLLDFIENAL